MRKKGILQKTIFFLNPIFFSTFAFIFKIHSPKSKCFDSLLMIGLKTNYFVKKFQYINSSLGLKYLVVIYC